MPAPTQQASTGSSLPAIRSKRTGAQGQQRSKPAKRLHGAHAAGRSADVEVAGNGGDAASRSSHSSCSNVICSCPDILGHDVSALHDSDAFSVTIRSPATFFCPSLPCLVLFLL